MELLSSLYSESLLSSAMQADEPALNVYVRISPETIPVNNR